MNLRELPFHALGLMGKEKGRSAKPWPLSLQEATKPTVSLSLEVPVREALKLMCEDNVPGVPVVGEDGALEGLVTDGYPIVPALPRYMRLMDNLSYLVRSFYRRKYDAVKMLGAFSAKLRDGARTPVPADAARCPKLI